jgi:hypothetical protein
VTDVSSISRKDRACTTFFFDRCLISPSSNFRSISTARLRCGSRHLGEELVGQHRDVRLLQPGSREDVDTSSDDTARETICRMAWSIWPGSRRSSRWTWLAPT